MQSKARWRLLSPRRDISARTIFTRVVITPRNSPRISARIEPRDQRDAIRPGIIISHSAFTNRQGQHGYVIISHTARRAGTCFGQERSEWGTWSEETGTITTDEGRLYNRLGETVCEVGNHSLEPGEELR